MLGKSFLSKTDKFSENFREGGGHMHIKQCMLKICRHIEAIFFDHEAMPK